MTPPGTGNALRRYRRGLLGTLLLLPWFHPLLWPLVLKPSPEAASGSRQYPYNCLMALTRLPDALPSSFTPLIPDSMRLPFSRSGSGDRRHVTVMYGIHREVDPATLKASLGSDLSLDDLVITGISCFETPACDIIKYDVESASLRRLHERLSAQLPHTILYPDYVPHLTIARVRPGMGARLSRRFASRQQVRLRVDTLVYSNTMGLITLIPLAGQRERRPAIVP